jgi:hypothetical protein
MLRMLRGRGLGSVWSEAGDIAAAESDVAWLDYLKDVAAQRLTDYQSQSSSDDWRAASEGADVLTTNSSAPATRTGDELSAVLKKAGGKLTVSAQSSLLVVALNNSLRFGIAKTASGNYEISEHAWGSLLSGNMPIYIGMGLVALVALGGGAVGRRY